MPKITFMGAGSTVFAKNVLGDSMMTPALEESLIALYDIDQTRLDESYQMLQAIVTGLQTGKTLFYLKPEVERLFVIQ